MIYKTLHIKPKIEQHEPGDELMCSGMVSSFCSTSDTRRVTLVKTRREVMNEDRIWKCLRQVEHICGYLWKIYSVTVNQVMVASVICSK
jgi:hypothetical protein